ncbi:YobI family P-loop NTPase [Pseudoalteromonas sp. AOP31-A2-14]|uniref:YobI family P-loop NTPase n=1 Tax=Pseudoalteromonas sp. AOP31-A2-14 TaxID=3457695 RepID=UPI004035EE2B
MATSDASILFRTPPEIYYQILNKENVKSIKLFALIIFKNVYPSDFELLHHRCLSN